MIRGNVWKATRKRKIEAWFNFNVHAWPSIQCLCFVYARKMYLRTHGKITRLWKSSFIICKPSRNHGLGRLLRHLVLDCTWPHLSALLSLILTGDWESTGDESGDHLNEPLLACNSGIFSGGIGGGGGGVSESCLFVVIILWPFASFNVTTKEDWGV